MSGAKTSGTSPPPFLLPIQDQYNNIHARKGTITNQIMAPPLAHAVAKSAKSAQSVHIIMLPTLRSLSDSRQVLAALQKFGEVVTFRNLKYDTTNTSPKHVRSAVAIFESPDSAARAIAASPLSIPSPPPPTAKTISPNIPNPNLIPAAAAAAAADPSRSPAKAPEDAPFPETINCIIEQSYHNHESALKRNPYFTAFQLDKESYHYQDLVNSTHIPLPELADGLMGRKWYAHGSVKRRILAENRKWGATSLWGLYKEGGWLEDNPTAAKRTDDEKVGRG